MHKNFGNAYEGVVEPSHKNSTRADANRDCHSRQMRVETALSKPNWRWSNALAIASKGI